jgi:hypothetical protein
MLDRSPAIDLLIDELLSDDFVAQMHRCADGDNKNKNIVPQIAFATRASSRDFRTQCDYISS